MLRPADDCVFAKSVEAADQDGAEAAAIGDEQRHRGDAPDDAQHGEKAASVVAPQRDPGFANDFE